MIGERLRNRNYQKRQRDDLVRRLLSYGHQMSSPSSQKNEILSALNEIKYWYSTDELIKKKMFGVMNTMSQGEDAQNDFIDLIQTIGKAEGHQLSREDVERVFSLK